MPPGGLIAVPPLITLSTRSAASAGEPAVQSISATGMPVSAASQRITSRHSAWTFSLTFASGYPLALNLPARTFGSQRRTMIAEQSQWCERWESRNTVPPFPRYCSRESFSPPTSTS